MTQHKWAKVINAWAAGAEIEYFDELKIRWLDVLGMPRWDSSSEYRIKPQPKEPQYLYVYFTGLEEVSLSTLDNLNQYELLGKIKLEVDDD